MYQNGQADICCHNCLEVEVLVVYPTVYGTATLNLSEHSSVRQALEHFASTRCLHFCIELLVTSVTAIAVVQCKSRGENEKGISVYK